MSPSLLLLLVSTAQASHFYGTVMTYYPKDPDAAGTIAVVFRYKLNFHRCTEGDSWTCSGNCGTLSSPVLNIVDQESSEQWCQREGIMTGRFLSNAPLQLQLSSGNWISNKNSVIRWKAVTSVELRTRSDTGRVNASPQTTILPALRVPSNCRRDFNLLAFDGDGDDVRCRYGNTTTAECDPCTPPSVLSLSSSCSLSFSPTISSNEGSYAVQLVMEDFTRQTINLTQNNGISTILTTNVAISKLPVQFAFIVDPVVPSCTEGLYLPKFLPPTPGNRARLYTPVNQSLEISINAEANMSTVSELLFSGPHNIINTTSGTGQYILRWTPSENEDGESHAICFVVQAVSQSVKYHSELRCVIVSVGNATPSTTTPSTAIPTPTTTVSSAPTTPPLTTPQDPTAYPTPVANVSNTIVALKMRLSSSSPLSEDDIKSTVIQQIRDELVRQGLPSDTTVRLIRSVSLTFTTTATPVDST